MNADQRGFARRRFLGLMVAATAGRAVAAEARPKNIVLIYADDLGYGDVGCYGATRVKTPHIDALAANGVRFTDAHTSAATCTPSRYSLMTGEYSFRVPEARVLPGDAPALIRPGRLTLASMLKERGFRTGVVGKWHLGLGDGKIDWNGEIKGGPLDVGFDECFIIPATGDRVPCVYVENRRVAGLDPKDPLEVSYKGPLDDAPTGKTRPDLLKMKPSHGHDMTIVNGISRIGFMKGGKSALWNDETMSDTLAEKAVSFIGRNASRPFFLFFSSHDIHVPRVPHPRFANSTDMGPRGNAIAELDDAVGKITGELKAKGLLQDTLIVFSSDNGGVLDNGYQDESVTKVGDHKPNGVLRGGKGSKFEGGTRVPFVVQWPAKLKRGVSDALVCQVDLLRSFASMLGASLPAGSAPDSEDLSAALIGGSKKGRQVLVEHAGGLSIRDGSWKYIPPSPGQAVAQGSGLDTGNSPEPQLYNLAGDIGEKKNLAGQEPERVKRMAALLEEIRKRGG